MTWASLALLLVACGSDVAPLRPDAGARDADLSSLSCLEEEGVRARVFERHCADADCHDADDPEAGLDLVSPGVTERIRDRPSILEGCGDRILVRPGNARASFMLDKVLALEGMCGDPMPAEGELPLEGRRCLVEWIDAMSPEMGTP